MRRTRLNVLTVDLPPLRDRLEDLPLLMDHFLARFFARRGIPVLPTSAAVMQAFLGYGWPGNVRELENVCERIAESCLCGEVRIGCLAASILFPETAEPAPPAPAHAAGSIADPLDNPEAAEASGAYTVDVAAENPIAAGAPTLSLDDQNCWGSNDRRWEIGSNDAGSAGPWPSQP
jgi:DNA-binding NtrC family response regulator